ncbi:MAG TPA: histidine--tRNA ligase [Burkholderiales bacterium]|nr:histidine--tRNA ligase [Burkholderiales bacterium]
MQKVKPQLLRGFDQEYLPAEQLQFNHLVDVIRRNFELFGFLPIETPSAERQEILTSKGAADKEIYALRRLADADDDDAASKGALRFDLTVPLARYVAMRERELAFPFRRYQIQRVWRGETPQANKGRFREFYQCDIDIIGREKLSYLAEAEIPSVIYSVFKEMAIGEFKIRINNRKVLKGLLKNFDVPEGNAAAVLRILDKVEKESEASLLAQLEKEGLGSSAKGLYGLMATKRTTEETLRALSDYPACADGVAELRAIVDAIRKFGVPDSAFAVDLAIVRGLDYYTGTIYETALTAYPEIGSICSGGRYDDLASYFTSTRLPGVGISIGLTRLFTKLKEASLLKPLPRTPAEVLITTMDHQYLDKYLRMAAALRAAGINTEVYLEAAKLDKQLQYAGRKEFRVALIAGETEFANSVVQIKDLSTRQSHTVPIDNVVTPIEELLKN